ncbi:MAG: glutamate---cysteine ligase / carboxylate-amine ligase [Cryptosporangiaceae bacterium]|jgi:carboxylate-amine ligase|nr:glutamate---cysteine ligase / carboxylate-amine ligase [Cryptosporangiaceae bacterium]
MTVRSVGVEEELLLVDPVTRRPSAVAAAVVRHSPDPTGDQPGGTVESELKQEQIEVDTVPCESLEDLRAEILLARKRAISAAAAVGAEVAALALTPLPSALHTTAKQRYARMAQFFGILEWDYLTCGCHVHVGMNSPEEAVGVLDRIRPWLPVLLALSANSPFAQGRDTGYASYRAQMAWQWPTAGPYELFGSVEAYDGTVEALIRSGAAMDPGMIYFDARRSEAYPTVEIRVADVCLDAADTVMIGGLSRALAETAAREWADGIAPGPWRTEVLRGATWRASRYGLADTLVHPLTGLAAPAAEVAGALLDHAGPALADAGDLDAVRDQVAEVLRRGSGAVRQRSVFERSARLEDVVADAVERTSAP